jgi:hypothetical protein
MRAADGIDAPILRARPFLIWENARNQHIPMRAITMGEPSVPDNAQTPDTPSAPESHALPTDVIEIVAALDAEEPGKAVEEPVESVAEEPAPEVPEEPEVPDAPPPTQRSLPRWPFILYDVVWIAAAAAVGWLLASMPDSTAIYETALYRWMVLAGLGLAALGPVLALLVWLVTMLRTRGRRHPGMLTRALWRGALATLTGVAVWWAMLAVVDTLRLGKPL